MAPPKAILFDIGGVCVVSPMQAIADYEAAHSIPRNWINYAISRSSSSASGTGAWQRAERGQATLEADWFEDFRRDLHDAEIWAEFCSQQRQRSPSEHLSEAPPTVDSTTLFWSMMIVSRQEDPHVGPALRALKASGRFLVAALSNTIAFPAWHPYGDTKPSSGGGGGGAGGGGKKPAAATVIGDVRDVFDVFVSSADAGVRKPDRAAYELAVRLMDECSRRRRKEGGGWTGEGGWGDIRAEDVVFLDDIGANLKPARELGMRTIKVELGRTDRAVAELERVTGMQLAGPRSVPDISSGGAAGAKL